MYVSPLGQLHSSKLNAFVDVSALSSALDCRDATALQRGWRVFERKSNSAAVSIGIPQIPWGQGALSCRVPPPVCLNPWNTQEVRAENHLYPQMYTLVWPWILVFFASFFSKSVFKTKWCLRVRDCKLLTCALFFSRKIMAGIWMERGLVINKLVLVRDSYIRNFYVKLETSKQTWCF